MSPYPDKTTPAVKSAVAAYMREGLKALGLLWPDAKEEAKQRARTAIGQYTEEKRK